jgi:hypothetical protein
LAATNFSSKTLDAKNENNFPIVLDEVVITAKKIEKISLTKEIVKPTPPKKIIIPKIDSLSSTVITKVEQNKRYYGNIQFSSFIEDLLSEYKGPKIKLNSGVRKWSKSSKHFHGNALDVAFSEDFIRYLFSLEGIKWLEDNDCSFFIENNKTEQFQFEHWNDKFRKIAHATGLHVHIEKN